MSMKGTLNHVVDAVYLHSVGASLHHGLEGFLYLLRVPHTH